jgi:chromate reductase, NAD(P)H dehydrogenase (quinone)
MPHPSHPITLVALSGSLRRGSSNAALLRAAADQVPPGVEVVRPSFADVPFYDDELEAAGLPAPVARLRDALAGADGLLLASPEYNRSTTGRLKNVIDWLSRGPDSPLDHLPTALFSAAGGSGGAGAQAHLRDILAHNRVQVLDGGVQVRGAWRYVADGELVDPEVRTAVADHVAALVAVIRARREDARAA